MNSLESAARSGSNSVEVRVLVTSLSNTITQSSRLRRRMQAATIISSDNSIDTNKIMS